MFFFLQNLSTWYAIASTVDMEWRKPEDKELRGAKLQYIN